MQWRRVVTSNRDDEIVLEFDALLEAVFACATNGCGVEPCHREALVRRRDCNDDAARTLVLVRVRVVADADRAHGVAHGGLAERVLAHRRNAAQQHLLYQLLAHQANDGLHCVCTGVQEHGQRSESPD